MNAIVENFDLILNTMENGGDDMIQLCRCAVVQRQVERLKDRKMSEVLK